MSVPVELSKIVIDLTDLAMQFKTAHWNVVGENFLVLHPLFDEIYGELVEFTDTIAERVRYFQYPVLGDIASLAPLVRFNPFDYSLNDEQLSADLLNKLREFSARLNTAILDVIKTDNSSADLLISVQQTVDKRIFFLQSFLVDDEEEEMV